MVWIFNWSKRFYFLPFVQWRYLCLLRVHLLMEKNKISMLCKYSVDFQMKKNVIFCLYSDHLLHNLIENRVKLWHIEHAFFTWTIFSSETNRKFKAFLRAITLLSCLDLYLAYGHVMTSLSIPRIHVELIQLSP